MKHDHEEHPKYHNCWPCRWLRQVREKLHNDPLKAIDLSFQFLGLLIVFIGGWVAIVELNHNTESLKTSNRVQLYTSDVGLSQEEFNRAGGKFWSVYARPATDNPTNYCRQLLTYISTDKSITGITNVEELYGKLISPESFKDADAPEDIAEMRRMYHLLSQILDEMHFAYDEWTDGVINDEELATWIGYVRAIGPNPMFLATIYHWHQENYMCRSFAEMLRQQLLTSTNPVISSNVVCYFYPEMGKPDFTNNLPDCGKEWTAPAK
jgi:hypothetical protein